VIVFPPPPPLGEGGGGRQTEDNLKGSLKYRKRTLKGN